MELPDRAEDRSEDKKRTDAVPSSLTAPPAGWALRCSLCVQAMLTQEPGSEVLLPSAWGRRLILFDRQHKNTDTNPCQTVLRASQNQAPTLSIQESPAAALNLSSGNAGSCCKGWYPCFCLRVMLFYESAESVPTSLGPGKSGEGNRKPVYRDSWLPVCQSCIPAGIFAIYMADGNRIRPWSFRISFSIHLYCISTPFLQPSLKILL